MSRPSVADLFVPVAIFAAVGGLIALTWDGPERARPAPGHGAPPAADSGDGSVHGDASDHGDAHVAPSAAEQATEPPPEAGDGAFDALEAKASAEGLSMFRHVSTDPFIGALKVERYALESNGLSVLLVADPQSETISYHTYFDVGSSDEVEGKTGLAHLFEHMMFKRTDKYDDQHFSKTIEEAGGPDLNAWTWLDITAYHVSLPKDQLPLIVDLEATRMHGLVIDQGQLDAEREVVLNERRYRVDNDPEGAINERLWALAFEKNRYHWPTIGWEQDIRGYTVADLEAFYKSWYAPNNATIVLVGGFDRDAALARIADAYGAISASQVQRLDHGDEPAQTELRRLDMEQPLEAEMIQLGFKVPAVTHPDMAALSVLDAILTAGSSSRLQRRLVDTGLATSADAFLPTFQHPSLYEFTVSMRPGESAEAALSILWREVAALAREAVDAEELERARNQLLTDAWDGLQSNSGKASFLGFNEVAAGGWQFGLNRIEQLRAVTAEDVRRAASTWLRMTQASMVVARPQGKALTPAPEALPVIEPSQPLPAWSARAVGQPAALPVGEVVAREEGGWTRLLVRDDAVPLVWFRVVLPQGSGRDPVGKEGLANVTAELLLRGTELRDRDAFERTLEGLGASVAAVVDQDTISLTGSVLASEWPAAAALLKEALALPRFDEDDLDDLIDEIQADLVDARNSDRGLGRKFLDEGLFGGHAYGRPVLGTEASLAAIARDDVLAFHRAWFSSRGAIGALLGDFDEQAPSDLDAVVAALPAAVPPATPALLPAVTGRSLWLVDKPDRSQLQIHLAHPAPEAAGRSFAAAWVANEAFGGSGFGTRLMGEVREKRGWSYGAYASFAPRLQGNAWTIWVFPATTDGVPCLDLVLELLQDFAARGITEDELRYARNSILNSAAFYEDTPARRLSYAVRRRLTGYDPLALLEDVRSVSLDEVNAAAAATFHPESWFGTVVGTASSAVTVGGQATTLEAALRARVPDLTVVPYDRD